MHEFLERLLTDQLTLEERLVYASRRKHEPSEKIYQAYVPRVFELLRHTDAAHLKRDLYLVLEDIIPPGIPNQSVLFLIKELQSDQHADMVLNILLKIQIPRHIDIEPVKVIACREDVNRNRAILVLGNAHWTAGEPCLIQLCRECQENSEDMPDTIKCICQALDRIGTVNSLSVLLALKQTVSTKQIQQYIDKTIGHIQRRHSENELSPSPGPL
ncbi:hypothetical protein [Pedobacter sp. V48]|uniref:hypothetical protein n=1 Tax=Pedobacter sp. V48 TaxID=509635 RepID=UPI0003E4AA73|nr:hypothetical protein [Pedobacter sp. V48]ETZ23084.1 hypothetical protein N824_20825 [Pedobacter sp. V48]